MFERVFPPIIRSSRLYTQQQVYVIQVCWLLPSGYEMEFHLVPANMQSTNLYDIYLMLCVQSWTPDDGRKDRPKHVEWFSINSKIAHLIGFTIEIYHYAWSNERHFDLLTNNNYITAYQTFSLHTQKTCNFCMTHTNTSKLPVLRDRALGPTHTKQMILVP
jgi:hypothetical protein